MTLAAELLQRARQELAINLTTVQETVLNISERVNRKVQILKLHWQASSLIQQIDRCHRALGTTLADHLLNPQNHAVDLDHPISNTAAHIGALKNDLGRLEARIRELETETLHDTLLTVQQDLIVRGGAIERVTLSKESACVGRSVRHIPFGNQVRIIALFRGAHLMVSLDALILQTGDVLLICGAHRDVHQALTLLTAPHRKTA